MIVFLFEQHHLTWGMPIETIIPKLSPNQIDPKKSEKPKAVVTQLHKQPLDSIQWIALFQNPAEAGESPVEIETVCLSSQPEEPT